MKDKKDQLPNGLIRLAKRLFPEKSPSTTLDCPAFGDEYEEFLLGFCSFEGERPVRVLAGDREETSGRAVFQPPWVSAETRALEYKETSGEGFCESHLGEYQLDLSSVFDISPLYLLPEDKRRELKQVLDLCSSPGGKAILASRILRPELLGCNEVIQKRVPALISNVKMCATASRVEVYSRDPAFFGQFAAATFDLVMVDAPCSGQSLYATRGAHAGVFHETLVKKNALRQRRILAEGSKAVVAGGYLLYMTCTFSLEENERVLEWFLKNHPDFIPVEIPELAEYRSRWSTTPCYRLFPHHGYGRGGFTAMLTCVDSGRARQELMLTPVWKRVGERPNF